MHHEPEFMPFKIDPVVPNAKALQNPSRPLEFAELINLRVHDLLRQTTKFTQNLQLQLLRHPRQFGGAGRVKNNLERAHLSTRSLPELLWLTSWKCPRILKSSA